MRAARPIRARVLEDCLRSEDWAGVSYSPRIRRAWSELTTPADCQWVSSRVSHSRTVLVISRLVMVLTRNRLETANTRGPTIFRAGFGDIHHAPAADYPRFDSERKRLVATPRPRRCDDATYPLALVPVHAPSVDSREQTAVEL